MAKSEFKIEFKPVVKYRVHEVTDGVVHASHFVETYYDKAAQDVVTSYREQFPERQFVVVKATETYEVM